MTETPLTPEQVPAEDPNRQSAMILTRRVGQTIHIGDNIVITVTSLDLRSKTVQLRISAPRSTPVNRGEVAANIARGNLTAATDDTPDAEFILQL